MPSVHDQHRQRVRNEFLARGFSDKTPEHKILEMLLFYSIPRKDTNELAHRLIDRFGSLSNLLDAKVESIMEVDGVGENTAALIKLMLPIIRVYRLQKGKENKGFTTTKELYSYIQERYTGITVETFAIMSFNSAGKMCGFDFLGSGDIATVGVTSRMVIEAVLRRNARCVIICHNHPGGNALPSAADIEFTEQVARALNAIEVILADHIILCKDDCVSLAVSSKYAHIFNNYAK